MYAALKQQNDMRQCLRGLEWRWRHTIFRCYRGWWETVKDIPARRRPAFDFHAVKADIDPAAIEQPEPEPAACPDDPAACPDTHDAPEPQPPLSSSASEGAEEVVVQISVAVRVNLRRR